MIQGSPEWHAARLGKVTASRMADVCARTAKGFGASRASYMVQLLAERLTGLQSETFTNAAMAWGTEKEPEARDAYAFETEAEVTEVGFIDHPTIPMTGASPDGLVGADGLLEIKCPNSTTHLETRESGACPAKYLGQVQWQLACTGRDWCDFVSFDPRMPAHLQLCIVRVSRDPDHIAKLEAEATAFLAELDAREAALATPQMKEAA